MSFFRGLRQSRHPRVSRGCLALTTLLLSGMAAAANAESVAFIPASSDAVLAHVPPGTAHSSIPQRLQADARLDVALPLAQYYISQARVSGDMRFLGYAEGALAHWTTGVAPAPPALVLQATILQSRHDFNGALADLDRALRATPRMRRRGSRAPPCCAFSAVTPRRFSPATM